MSNPETTAPKYFDDDPLAADALRHKLLADIFGLPIWYRGKDRVVTPPWQALTIEERDLIADALSQWRKRDIARMREAAADAHDEYAERARDGWRPKLWGGSGR